MKWEGFIYTFYDFAKIPPGPLVQLEHLMHIQTAIKTVVVLKKYVLLKNTDRECTNEQVIGKHHHPQLLH